MIHICNPITQEDEAGGLPGLGSKPGLQHEAVPKNKRCLHLLSIFQLHGLWHVTSSELPSIQ